MGRRVGAFALFFLLLSTTAFAVPLEIVLEDAQKEGLTVVRGKTNLPDGTRLGVILTKKVGYSARDYDIFVKDGRFESIGFTDRGYRLVGKFELTIISFFNENWQKPNVLDLLREYTSPYLKNGRLRIVKTLAFYYGQGPADKAELERLKKHLETLQKMRAELQKAASDRAVFSKMSPDWNQRLKKERDAFLGEFGKTVDDYNGGCVNAYRYITLAQRNMIVLWQKYDDFLAGRGEVDFLGKMDPTAEQEMDEIMNRAEYSIDDCAP